MFIVVMGALFLAFAIVFNILLCTKMSRYGSFWNTLEVLSIEGLMGNMDYSEISRPVRRHRNPYSNLDV